MQVTYFDFLGMFVVVYPERLGVVLNVMTILVTVVTVWGAARRGSKWKWTCMWDVGKGVT